MSGVAGEGYKKRSADTRQTRRLTCSKHWDGRPEIGEQLRGAHYGYTLNCICLIVNVLVHRYLVIHTRDHPLIRTQYSLEFTPHER